MNDRIEPPFTMADLTQEQRDSIATGGALYPVEHVIEAQPTAWQSVPGFVRVAVWLWALVTVLGFAAGLVFSAIWVIALMLAFGSQ